MTERLSDINFAALNAGKTFQPSPHAWEVKVLYFLLLDRFSDNNKQRYKGNNGLPVTGGQNPPYHPVTDNGNAVATETNAAGWREAGQKWCGGTLLGLNNKISYRNH